MRRLYRRRIKVWSIILFTIYYLEFAGDDRIGYREEKNVRPDSRTDSYVAMCLYVDNWRWQGVPIPIFSTAVIST